MLVLSRKIGNWIVIAGDIEIIVLKVHGNRVRLGVNAPQDVSIVRCDARKQVCPALLWSFHRAEAPSCDGKKGQGECDERRAAVPDNMQVGNIAAEQMIVGD